MGVEQVPAVVAGRYRLRDVVGAGGMGTVWRAADEVLGREVAVKRVRLDGLPPAEAALARERTMREARIAAALHHPHIVSIFDVVLEDGEPWLILEYLPSRSLGSILDEYGTLPPTGRPGSVLATEDGCWVQFVQHDYTGESRIEEVWLMVLGPGRGADSCGTATALATAAASKLPPPG